MLTTTDIRQFLLPRRIALIGASDSSRFARAIVETNRQLGFSGKLYFINPNQTSVMGAACHPNLDALPERVDSAVICVPRMHVRGQIEDCIRAGVKGAVLHTAGYAEADGDGAEAQADLVSLCRAHGFGMLGPNCLGSFSNAGKVSLYGGPLPADLPSGGISVVAQSGSAAIALMNSGRGLGFNYIASTGNEAVVTTEQLIELFIEDDATRVVVAFVESFRDPAALVRVADKARRASKPIIVLKVGLTNRGARAAMSHTGGMAGSGEVHEAVFEHLGIVQVRDYAELFETALLFSKVKHLPRSGRTVFVTTSGGESAMLEDLAPGTGVEIRDLSPSMTSRLNDVFKLPHGVSVRNPIDVGIAFRSRLDLASTMLQSVAEANDDPSVDVVAIAQDTHRTLTATEETYFRDMMGRLKDASASHAKPVVLFGHLPVGVHPSIAEALRESPVATLAGTSQTLKAIGNLCFFGKKVAERAEPAHDDLRADIEITLARDASLTSNQWAKRLLQEIGIPTPAEMLVDDAKAAGAAAERIGFPVVMKIETRGPVHKSDIGGVRLNVNCLAEAELAFDEIVAAARKHLPEDELVGIVVARQVETRVELILGAKQDPQFGPIVVVGLGGTMVELLGKVRILIPPITPEQARSALLSLPGHELLTGFRGSPPADVDAAADALVKFARLACQGAGLFSEFEINPLDVGVRGSGVTALDARIVERRHTAPARGSTTSSILLPVSG